MAVDEICIVSKRHKGIEILCDGEITYGLQENNPEKIITALRDAIQRLSPENAVILLEQGIGLDFEAPELALRIEKELAMKTYAVRYEDDFLNEIWDDCREEPESEKSSIPRREFDFLKGLDEEEIIQNVIANQAPCIDFDETGKYYLHRDNFARENQRTFDTIAEAYDFLCQDADGACIFFCDGYGESQEPPTLDWLKKVINSCGKVEVEIGFPDGAKDIWIYQKER